MSMRHHLYQRVPQNSKIRNNLRNPNLSTLENIYYLLIKSFRFLLDWMPRRRYNKNIRDGDGILHAQALKKAWQPRTLETKMRLSRGTGMRIPITICTLLMVLLIYCSLPSKGAMAASTVGVPLDIVLVIDNSGSVRATDPKGFAGIAGERFIDYCSRDDQVGIIIFGSKAKLLSSLRPASDDNKRDLKKLIDGIEFNDQYTDINSGLEKAYEELRIKGRKNAIKGVIMISDGRMDLPEEEQQIKALLDLYGLMLKYSTDNIPIHSLLLSGNGRNSYQLMYDLANSTGGKFLWAFSPEELQSGIDTIYQDLERSETETRQLEILKRLAALAEETGKVQSDIKSQRHKEKSLRSYVLAYLLLWTVILVIGLYLLNQRLKVFGKHNSHEKHEQPRNGNFNTSINDTLVSTWGEIFKRTKNLIDGLKELSPMASQLEKDIYQKYQADVRYLELINKYIDAILYCEQIEDESGMIEAVKRRLESMLETQGIERWVPETGKPAPSQAETYPVETSQYPPGAVVEVISPGFRTTMDEGVVKPPKVAIAVPSDKT